MGENCHNDSADGNKYERILHSVVLYSEQTEKAEDLLISISV